MAPSKKKKNGQKTIGFRVRKNPFPNTQDTAPCLGEVVGVRTATLSLR